MPTFNELVRKLISLPEDKRNAVLEKLKIDNLEGYKKLTLYFKQNPGAILEAQGYEPWLKRLGPHSFTRPLAPIQHKFWQWNWPILQKVQESIPLQARETVGFLPWPRETGKCLAAGTEILKEDGSRIPIEAIRAGDRLLSIDQSTGRCVADVVKQIWNSGLKPCSQIVLRSGKSLILTSEHRLWTLKGWKSVRDLNVGDRIAAPRRTRPKAVSERTDSEVKLTAYMIAEGCTVRATSKWTTRSGVIRRKPSSASKASFTNADRVIVADFKTSAAGMGFGVNQVRHNSDRAHITYGLVGAQQWLRDTGLGGKGAHEKRIPKWVFGLPEYQRWMFLAALIDTDGYVTDSDGVAIALANEHLITDISYLFTSVGVPSKVFFRPNACRGAWILQASKGATRLLYERLPLLLKTERLRILAESQEDSLLDAYPSFVGKNLPKGVHRAIRNAGGPKMGTKYPTLTRSKIRRAMECCPLAQWRWLEVADVMWDEIRKTEPAGQHETYDIQMSSTSENFIANGVVSHNSTHVEWACIAEGALLKIGYVIYLSAKLSQAIDHVVAIRDRIESEKVADLYPWLGKPKLGAHGNKFGWGQEFLMTSGGWAIRPIGADVAARGGKAINIRPTLIVPDDYDELGDSPHVVEHKEHLLTRAILPMGNANTRVLVPQNPIHPNSVVNRMLTGVSLALAMRTVFGEINDDGSLSSRPIPAVKGLVYEIRQSDEGPYSEITQGKSLWDGISKDDWQATLNRVGPDAFKAEYQHDMTVSQEERVLPEYDDRHTMAHVITWDQFEAKYGMRRVPSDWRCDAGLDIGYSTGHKSAWSFISKVPQGVDLAGSIFRYRGRTFTGVSIDDQSLSVRGELWKDENLQRQFMSHEKLGERITLNTKHGWHFHPCDSAKESGIPQWRHHLRVDRRQPHPFHRDEKDEHDLWKIGRPSWFDVVDSKQFRSPVDDYGLKRHRDSAYNWRRVPVKLTDKGVTVDQPAKINDDEVDSTRSLLAGTSFGPMEQPMNQAARIQSAIPAGYHRQELAQRADLDPARKEMTGFMAEYLANKSIKKPTTLYDAHGQRLR